MKYSERQKCTLIHSGCDSCSVAGLEMNHGHVSPGFIFSDCWRVVSAVCIKLKSLCVSLSCLSGCANSEQSLIVLPLQLRSRVQALRM